jgi:redox-sensing transcriptional repressor
MKTRKVPQTTIARLPLYLRCLIDAQKRQVLVISSQELSELAGGNAAQVRKDLSYLGEFGTRGIGYEVDQLILHISRILGLTRPRNVAIVGMGRLGPALLGYQGFSEKGFNVVAVFDRDPDRIGQRSGDLVVQDSSEIAEAVGKLGIEIAIITTPASVAQKVADALVEAGVKAILNFAPTHIEVPETVNVRQVDLSVELQILTFHLARQSGLEAAT